MKTANSQQTYNRQTDDKQTTDNVDKRQKAENGKIDNKHAIEGRRTNRSYWSENNERQTRENRRPTGEMKYR